MLTHLQNFLLSCRLARLPSEPLYTVRVLAVLSKVWRDHILIVCEALDNARISRVPEAGELNRGTLIMHSGFKVAPLRSGNGLREATAAAFHNHNTKQQTSSLDYLNNQSNLSNFRPHLSFLKFVYRCSKLVMIA